MAAALIALRTRQSQRDSRVTLVTLANAAEVEEDKPLPSASTSSPLTSTSRSRRSRSEQRDASSPATPASKRVRRIKHEYNDDDAVKAEASPPPSSPQKRPPTPTKLRAKLVEAHPEPPRWRETYEIIRKQRETLVAAVDLMGCDAIAGMKEEEHVITDKDRRLASLISLMLSSQTKDPVTHEATMNLRRNLRGGLCLEGLLSATDEEIQACINKVGFWRRKTDYIRRTAEILRDKFDGDVPKTIEDLLILPGVGPKMGWLCLQAAWGITEGIGVDTHVHRITNRLGWHRKAPKDPEETRVNLESWLPKELYNHINIMLVGLGQTICLPINPRCDLCHLGQMDDSPCPSKRKVIVKQAKLEAKQESIPTGEVGPMTDTLLEIEETDVKPTVEILQATVGPTDTALQAQEGKTSPGRKSPYFGNTVNNLSW